MIISVTERGTFRRCKRQWDYASFNRQGLTSVVPPTALSFGTIIHKCHELWLLNPDKPVNEIVMEVGAQGVRDLKERYKEKVGVEPSVEELGNYFSQIELALEIMTNYKEKWGASLPSGYELLQPEQTIVIPIPGTEHPCSAEWTHQATGSGTMSCPSNECDGTGVAFHYIEGTLDALIRDAGGRLWVLERKTYKNRPNVESLRINDQFRTYGWIVTQLIKSLGEGEFGGIFYDGMWKNTYDKKRTLDDLFMREPLLVSPEEINNVGRYIRDEALDMAQPDLRIYPNLAWTGCWDCQFNVLCTATDRGEDTAYIRAKRYVARTRNEWQEDAAE